MKRRLKPFPPRSSTQICLSSSRYRGNIDRLDLPYKRKLFPEDLSWNSVLVRDTGELVSPRENSNWIILWISPPSLSCALVNDSAFQGASNPPRREGDNFSVAIYCKSALRISRRCETSFTRRRKELIATSILKEPGMLRGRIAENFLDAWMFAHVM